MNRRGLRLAVITVVVVAAVMAAGLAALPEIVRRVAAWSLAASTGRAVTIDAVELRLLRGRVAMRGLRVMDHDGSPLATLGGVEAHFRPRALLGAHLRILDATIDAPSVRIVRTGPREFNISDLLGRPAPERGPTTARVTLERVHVRGGTLVVEDRTASPARTWRVDGLTVDVRGASTVSGRPPGTATLEATVAGAPLTVAVTDLRLAPLQARAIVTARAIPVALATLAMPPAGPLGPPDGTVSVYATVDHDAATGTLVAGEVGLVNVEIRRMGEARPLASAPAVRVTLEGLRLRGDAVEVRRFAVDGGSVTLEDARLGRAQRWRIDGLAFEARDLSSARDAPAGTATGRAAMAGAQISGYAANVRLAPLELHATTIIRNADLSVLRVSLPATLPVQPERGVVNATVRVDHDATRGTRLAVDAGIANLELRRPAHFVTAPALRVLAEEIVVDRGQVTVGHAALTGARLTLEERTATPVRTWVVQNLAAEATGLSSRPDAVQGVATVQATVAGASVAAFVTQARLDPLEFSITANVRNLDATLLHLYLPPQVPLDPTRGVINAAVRVTQTAARGMHVIGDATVSGFQARGRGATATTTFTAPSLRVTLTDGQRQAEALSVGRVELSGTGSVVDSRTATSRVDFTQLRVASEGLTWPVRAPARVEVSARFGDRGELDATGTAMLTAPLPRVGWSAELALAFRSVDLAPLGAYVPAARGVGGRVRATLTATVAYTGALTAHVRGDVAGGRFALVDGDRTVLSLRRVDATGLDVRWPERIAIAQVRLREPYALVERDRQGRLALVDRFAPPAPAGATPAPTPGEAKPRVPPIAIAELIVESGRAVVVDASGSAPARIEVPRIDLTARDVAWPRSSTPARVVLDVGLAEGGSLKAEGTVTAEPASVDLKVALGNADVEILQPYLPFRARVRAKVDATLAVAGPVAPTPRIRVQGEAGVRTLSFADGTERLITVQYIGVSGIDATWPERVTIDRVRVRRSWALIERDRQGRFVLRAVLERAPGTPMARPPAIAAPARPTIPLTVRELVLEQQGATIVDSVTTPPGRLEVGGALLKIADLTWPSQAPMKIELSSPMPGGGRMDVTGTLDLDPFRLDARAVLAGVALSPVRPYLPIEGIVSGQVSGEVAVKVAIPPGAGGGEQAPPSVTVQVTGQTQLLRFQLNDGERPVITVGRVDVAGIDVDWPRRLAVQSVLLRRPRLLVERDPLGQIRLWRVAVPEWSTAGPGAARAPAATPASTAPAPAAPGPVIEVATLKLERASARFVDQSTTPTYAEELSNVEVTVSPLSTAPGQPTRFTASGSVGGGSFTARGEAAAGERTHVALTVNVRDFIVPRANPYLDLYTGWTASRGSVDVTGVYTLTGTRIETHHEVVARDVDVAPVDTRDEVERRVGLPFGLLVSLLKDARGAIKLAVPVSGDLGRREFDFEEAMWGAVRALALRLVALPFSRIGSLFVSADSKVEAVAIAPVLFEGGTATPAAGMAAHLQKVAAFLRDAPAVVLTLRPIFTQADADAVKDAADPAEAMRALGEGRLRAVREALARAGVDGARLQGRVPRRPLVEAAGPSRVELDPPGRALDEVSRGG